MRLSSKPAVAALIVLAAFSTAIYATDIPNWTPAPYNGSAGASRSGPLKNIGSNTFSTSFVALTPCRMYDTRSFGPATPLSGGSSITVNPNGTYPAGFTPCPNIPTAAAAYSVNITVFGSTANGSFAFLTAYPTGTTRPTVSTMNFSTGSQTSNAAAITAGTSGSFDVYTTYTTNFTIDINGYYTLWQNAGDAFASVSVNNYGIYGGSTNGYGIWGNSTNNIGVYGTSAGNSSTYGIYGSGSTSATGVYGTSTNNIGVHGFSTNYNGVWADSTTWDAVAAFGGRDGGYFQGARYGAVGTSTPTGAAGELHGLVGSVSSTSARSSGVKGTEASGEPTYPADATFLVPRAGVSGVSADNVAVLGLTRFGTGTGGDFIRFDTTAPNNVLSRARLAYSATIAGIFTGDVQVTGNLSVGGTLSKAAGTFKIDHPLDPDNKYLYHSFVESPDMMNVYNGVIVLDAQGEAIVQLPDYFDALNMDPRYQLTSIGRFAPVYIAEEISNNQFKIAGGRAGMKVSWQVTGIRNDPYARAHRVQVVVDKEPENRGKYLTPVEEGKPASLSIEEQAGQLAPERATEERLIQMQAQKSRQ